MSFLYRFLLKLVFSIFNRFDDYNKDSDATSYVQRHPNLVKLSWLFFILKNILDFNRTYYLLSDVESKELMIQLLLYRVLGYKKVKLRTNTPEFWKGRNLAEELKIIDNNSSHPEGWNLSLFDLARIGYPIRVYSTSVNVAATFLRHAYDRHDALREAGILELGNYIIDAGGCWGDTALFFAHRVGSTGKVYSFEFVDQNIDVFKQNLELNPELAKSIELIPRPLFGTSDIPLYYKSKGPSTRVSKTKLSQLDLETRTLSVDDFVADNQIQRIDLIKMDIEGAELDALKGAVETIKRYRPKLAICLYHKKSDFVEIPKFISGLGIYTQYFLGHNSIHAHETVLFCE